MRAEASARALDASRKPVRAADARHVVALALAATEELRYTWEYPRRVLAESGMEAAAFCDLCRSVLEALDWHLAFLGAVRRLGAKAAGGEGAGELDAAEAQARTARRAVEDLIGFATRPAKPVDWDKVREAEEAIGRGEYVRLNPNARAAAGG
jgi:hypothetical protein